MVAKHFSQVLTLALYLLKYTTPVLKPVWKLYIIQDSKTEMSLKVQVYHNLIDLQIFFPPQPHFADEFDEPV